MWRSWCKYKHTGKDYRVIFNMPEDRSNPKNLDICRQHAVFQHFPMQRLLDSPESWSVKSYKYGQLIALDLSNLDWIYVIKSGEARVLQYLQASNVDLKASRQKMQALIRSQSPFHRKQRLLSFVQQRAHIQSAYRQATYHPAVSKCRLTTRSAPPTMYRRPKTPPGSSRLCVSPKGLEQLPVRQSLALVLQPAKSQAIFPPLRLHDNTNQDGVKSLSLDSQTEESSMKACAGSKQLTVKTDNKAGESSSGSESLAVASQPVEVLERSDKGSRDIESGDGCQLMIDSAEKDIMGRQTGVSLYAEHVARATDDEEFQIHPSCEIRSRSRNFLKILMGASDGSLSPNCCGNKSQVIRVGNHTLPAFVHVDTLHSGQVFGLRACLAPEERGPSVSLVSGECEVLQINKKFFMKYCDEAVYSLIRLKSKPFSSMEDLIDRLDVSIRWEDFKKRTLRDVIKQCRSVRS